MKNIDSGFGWKANWAETRQHFTDWWNRKGLVVTSWGVGLAAKRPHDVAEAPARSHSDIFV